MLLITLFAIALSKPLNPKKVLYAINCGAPSSFKGRSGINYDKDVQSDPNTIAVDYSTNSEVASQTIKYTREPDIYLTERHAYQTFGYQVPLQKEGTYVLILKFAEMYFNEKGKRVFHVKFGETRVVENLDIVAKVGKFASHDEYIEFEYIAGLITVNGKICIDAVMDGKLDFQLEKSPQDNPYIHGLILYAGSLNDTDYADYQNLKNNWDSIQKEEAQRQEQERLRKQDQSTKRKERVKIRNDHINELDIEDDVLTLAPLKVSSPRSIKQFIVSVPGTAIIASGFLLVILVVKLIFKKIDSVIMHNMQFEFKEEVVKKVPIQKKK